MDLKILLPYKIFLEVHQVRSVVVETSIGSYGLLPQRLDCVAALVPSILTYTTENDIVNYVAVDEGVMVKAGTQVLVSVRNAFGGADLGKLGELIKNRFNAKVEKEREAKTVIAKLERSFVYSFDKFRNS
ncbi:hypothetical protein LCGC14_0651870 [marine sediment metagenome]|uniref:F0F1 ATP synthase subunit epsilon n=2 Tax=root TaxID=1 RepID=A0A831VW53_9FLAO|nr:F0F1 ATP synthase subunit epsilon [Pricia antarctica]